MKSIDYRVSYTLASILCIIFSILCVMSALASAEQVYIWIDEKGIPNATTLPPDKPAKIIEQPSLKVERPRDNPVNTMVKLAFKAVQHENRQRGSSMAGLSRENPIPLGVRALMSDGIEMTVLSFDRDPWPKVRAKNQFNTPPAHNKRMLMIRIRIKNVSAPKEPVVWRSLYEIALVGSYNRVWKFSDSESGCGAIPDAFGEAELYRDGEKEGSVCFQIPKDETNLLLRYDENQTLSTMNYKYFVAEK